MLKIDGKTVLPADLAPFLGTPWCGVDMHWHARDFEHRRKDTMQHSLQLAYAAGLTAVGAMPNTIPSLTTLELCREYLALADQTGVPIQFFLHIGLTPDVEQVKRAVEAVRKNPRIIGMKAYWGRSTGDLSIIREDQQYAVWETLAKEGYEGVIVGHYEEEFFLGDALFNRESPKTWSTVSRPESAEITSFHKNTWMANKVKFKGRIHVAHVSTPHVVEEIYRINNYAHHFTYLKGRISCGITPHHWTFNSDVMDGPNGLEYKCNPALREELTREVLKAHFFSERIPIGESDHAPHSEEDKHGKDVASGISGGGSWPYVVALMRLLGMPEDCLRRVTFDNALKLYNLQGRVEYNPRVPDLERLAELQGVYHFDAFKELKS